MGCDMATCVGVEPGRGRGEDMKRFGQIAAVLKQISAFCTKRWYALVAPTEVRDEKNIANYIKLVDAAEKNYRDSVDWQIKKYKEIGCSQKDIRDKVLPMIKGEQANIAILWNMSRERLLKPPDNTAEKPTEAATA